MNKDIYTKKYNYLKRRKLFIFLVILFFLSLLLGVFYYLLGSNSNKEVTVKYYNDFFNAIKGNNINYLNFFINSFSSNVICTVILFLFSISIIGIIFFFFFFLFHSFTLGYTFMSFISIYKFKGLVSLIIYIFPLIIHIMLLFVLCFYSYNFASRFYKYLIKKKDVSVKSYFRRYLKVFFIILLILFINSIFESIIVPILLKTFTNSLI